MELGSWHGVPPGVLTSVIYWVQKGEWDPRVHLEGWRGTALGGAMYCYNDGCEVVGHLKGFKVCPQCKHARYCGGACQKQDWNADGHKTTCGTFESRVL